MTTKMHDVSPHQIFQAVALLADNTGEVTGTRITEALTEYADTFVVPEDMEALRGSVDDIDIIIERLGAARKQLVREMGMREVRRADLTSPAETAIQIDLARRGA